MNTLCYYPIIMPIPSSGSSGDISMEVIYAILIVANVWGAISLLIGYIINAHNKKKYGEESLISTIHDYLLLFLGIWFPLFIDIIAIFIGLVFWIADML